MSFKSKKKRSRSEAESSDAVSDDERELEDTEEEEEDDWSSDFDPSMVCLVGYLSSECMHTYIFSYLCFCGGKQGKPTCNVSLLACSYT